MPQGTVPQGTMWGYAPLPILTTVPNEQFRWPPRRRYLFTLFMFLLTCASTFWAGAAREWSATILQGLDVMKQVLAPDWWQDGLVYMGCVMATLLAHEMGHFVMTVRYRIPATLPLFLPLPITPVGTMGAVIAMHGSAANRKQIFDIGIAGPLAGLVVCLPVVIVGILTANVVSETLLRQPPNQVIFHDPLLVEWLTKLLRPDLAPGQVLAMTPLRLAGWFGLIITGLNMMPISQLDGGHVTYTLFGKRSYVISAVLVISAIGYVVLTNTLPWVVMLVLVLMMGIFHPPTADDSVPIGRFRYILGLLSLALPILCFSPQLVEVLPNP